MSSRKWFLGLIACVVFIVGCNQEKTKRRETIRSGRGSLTNGGSNTNGVNSAGQYWGSITNYSAQSIDAFVQPSFAGLTPEQLAEEQLGNIMGVYMRGPVVLSNQTVGAASQLYIEVWDDKVSSPKPSGGTYQQFQVQLGSGAPGHQSVQGTVQNGQVTVTFTTLYHTVTVSGSVQADRFIGSVTFANAYTYGPTQLGQFNMHRCDFFRC